jgi:hypothetical protein
MLGETVSSAKKGVPGIVAALRRAAESDESERGQNPTIPQKGEDFQNLRASP